MKEKYMIIREWIRVEVDSPPKNKPFIAYFEKWEEQEIVFLNQYNGTYQTKYGQFLGNQDAPQFSHWCLIDKPHD